MQKFKKIVLGKTSGKFLPLVVRMWLEKTEKVYTIKMYTRDPNKAIAKLKHRNIEKIWFGGKLIY